MGFLRFLNDFYRFILDWKEFRTEWGCYLSAFSDLTDAVDRIDADVTKVANALAGLRDEVAALMAQIEVAVTAEQAAELRARLDAADAALDAVVPDPEPAPVE